MKILLGTTSTQGTCKCSLIKAIGVAAPEHSPSGDGEYYREYKAAGISVLCNREDRIVTVFLYSGGREGYAQFRHSLPRGLRFEDDRASATRKLGLPACAGGGEKGVLGLVEIWDTWATNWGVLHVAYRPDGRIGLVTLMIPSRDPGCRDSR